MGRAFEILDAKGQRDGTFSIEFVADEFSRTAVKVTRLSPATIRFSPVVGYSIAESDGDDVVYRAAGALSAV